MHWSEKCHLSHPGQFDRKTSSPALSKPSFCYITFTALGCFAAGMNINTSVNEKSEMLPSGEKRPWHQGNKSRSISLLLTHYSRVKFFSSHIPAS